MRTASTVTKSTELSRSLACWTSGDEPSAAVRMVLANTHGSFVVK